MDLSILYSYIEAVSNGKANVSKYEFLAVQRYLKDLQSEEFYFNEKRAVHALNFFSFLRLWKGSFSGKPFELAPFQMFIIWNLFGFFNHDNSRRFRTAYIEIPRKNGKTGLAAGIALYMLFADPETGAEIYSAATKKDQAKLSFNEAVNIIKKSPELKKRCKIYSSSVAIESKNSFFQPLSSDVNTLDGLNTHFAILDEVHAHPTAGVVDLINTSTGFRDSPLIFEITTAGRNLESICYEHREYSINILEGAEGFQDNSWFSMIFSIDKNDSWKDRENWRKANPNFNKTIKDSYLENQFKRALSMKSYENTFKRLHLNIWTEEGEVWIDRNTFDGLKVANLEESLEGLECYGGLDLAKINDFNAFTLIFNKEGVFYQLAYIFTPEETVKNNIDNKLIPYPFWVQNGDIIEMPGNVRDDDFLINFILDLSERFQIKSIAYDRFDATNIIAKINEFIECNSFGQGFVSMNTPVKEYEKIVISNRLFHCGNACFSWMMNNVVISTDASENKKIDKRKSGKKVDGPVSAVMALGEYLRNNNEAGGTSIYNNLDILNL